MKRRLLLIVFSLSLGLGGCHFWDNSMTFFNTYYNQKKLMAETEEEFGYNDYLKPPKPRVIAPQEHDLTLEKGTNDLPAYVSDMIVKPQKLQPVQVKVDSIIIKGSKILATHPKSSFVDGSLYLMAKAFFYRSEWLPSNIKCQEIAENYPNSPYSPDAHLLSAKNYLLQRNLPRAKIMLSRTIDVAWQQERYDVLSEAFELTAEEAIEEEDYDGAERPYRQAINQCDDEAQKAKWQCDLGLVLYRLRIFDKANKELAKVDEYSPTPLTEFEAKYYRALSLAELKHFDEADNILANLDKNRNFDEYAKLGYQNSARLQIARLRGNADSLAMVERAVDSTSSGSVPLLVANFERGLDLYRAKDYDKARLYFAKAKVVRSPIFDGANTLFTLLNTRELKMTESKQLHDQIQTASPGEQKDSLQSLYARTIFELGRTNEEMGNKDSAEYYFHEAMTAAPDKDTLRAQYLYSYGRMVAPRNPELSDSLQEEIFAKYPKTVYGDEARHILGITDYALLDSAEELYKSGTSFRNVGDYSMANRQYYRVFSDYRNSKFAPAALYAIGWVWEQKLNNNDSAFYYYGLLIKRYPFSEYADDIRFAVSYGAAKRGIADSTSFLGNRRKPGEVQDQNAVKTIPGNGSISAPGGTGVNSAQPGQGQNSPSQQPVFNPRTAPQIPASSLNPQLGSPLNTPFNQKLPSIDSVEAPTPTPSDSTKTKPKK